MIQQLSVNMGDNLAKYLGYERPQAEIFAYALQIILESTIKVGLVLTSAAFLGIGKPAVIVLVTYGVIRSFGGGVHLSTFPRCLTVGGLLIIGLAALSTLFIPNQVVLVLFASTLIWSLVSIRYWVPAGTEKKRITDLQVRKKQKLRTLWVILFWCAIVAYLTFSGQYLEARAVIYGAIGALFLISPVGYGLLSSFDKGLDRMMKGGVNG